MKSPLQPIILSGGGGQRLWPLSRQSRPKQFLNIKGEISLFAQTLIRTQDQIFSSPLIVCNNEHRFLVAETMRQLNITPSEILLEPVARNTMPAIAAATLKVFENDANATIIVLPSDHIIDDTKAFYKSINAAYELAADGYLVAFGVEPQYPETGYGYIKKGSALGSSGWSVETFVEKPSHETAKTYITEGGYFWNAGIFLFKVQSLLDELKRLKPDVLDAAKKALEMGKRDLDFIRLDQKTFQTVPNVAFDYAVMEKTDSAALVLLDAGWDDIGSWTSLWRHGKLDKLSNVIEGPARLLDSHENYVHSEKPLIAMLGVKGLAVIATDDTVLILPKERAQEVKDIVTCLEASGYKEATNHTNVYRPWGHYQNLEDGEGFLVKHLVVNPGAKLSMQYHEHRSEHWVVISGEARVTNGENTFNLYPNESTYIPLLTKHRLENPGSAPLHLIEVQAGDYIGEDDIVRLEDTYKRS